MSSSNIERAPKSKAIIFILFLSPGFLAQAQVDQQFTGTPQNAGFVPDAMTVKKTLTAPLDTLPRGPVGPVLAKSRTIYLKRTMAGVQKWETDSTLLTIDATHFNGNFSVENPFSLKTPNVTQPGAAAFRSMLLSKTEAINTNFETVQPENGYVSRWRVDTLDKTTVDDTFMVVVGYNGMRIKRDIPVYPSVKMFGAYGDGVHDDTEAFRRFWRWCVRQQKRNVFFIPAGNYLITSTLIWDPGAQGQFPRILGESKGVGSNASTIVWGGAKDGTMIRIRHMVYSSIAHVDFQGRNGKDFAHFPKYLIWMERTSAAGTDISTFNQVTNCSFFSIGGAGSAMINLNVGGAFQSYMMDEVHIDNCIFGGNNDTVLNRSSHALIIGGANTKNVYITYNNFSGFADGIISASYIGPLNSTGNLYSNSGSVFDLTNNTTLVSTNDYSESVGRVLTGPGGTAAGSFTLIGYEDHSFNYKQHITRLYGTSLPETNQYRINGVGQLYMEGCTFDNAEPPPTRYDSLSKINWNVGNSYSSVTAINCNFSGAREGRSPFFNNGIQAGVSIRSENLGLYAPVHLTSINNKGIDSTYAITYPLPAIIDDGNYQNGITKRTTYIDKPVAGNWYIGDEVTIPWITNEGPGGDGRHRPKKLIVSHPGTFKTINITGTATTGSSWITNVSNTTKVALGDIINIVGGFSTLSTYEIAEISGRKFRVGGGFTSSSNTLATITNSVPVFTAMDRGYGNTATRPGSSTLTVNDVGWPYWSTDSIKMQNWTGTGWAATSPTFTQTQALIQGALTNSNKEDIILVATKNYTVATSSGFTQNLIYEYAAGRGTFTLPSTSAADGLTLYISNTSSGTITFSQAVYSNSATSTTVLAAGGHMKIVKKVGDTKYYQVL